MYTRLIMILALLVSFPMFGAAEDLIAHGVLEESKGVQDELVIDMSVDLVGWQS